MVSEREVQRMLLPHFLLYGILLIALAAAFALGLSLLQREFITWARIVARTSAAHRQARQELKESEAFKSAIIDNAMLAVITIDVAGRIVEFNPAAQAIFGHRLDDAKGRDMADLIMPERLRAAHRRGLQSYRDKGALRLLGRRLEMPALRADGTEFPIALSISVTEVGRQRYFTAFISDLTEQKRATEELARQREALRQSEKLSAMGSLLAGIAHELNNPLAILLARAALLAGKVSDPAALADVDRIRAAAERCGRIVKTFLSMARQRPADRRPAQLNDIVAGALDLVNYSWRTAGITVRADLAPRLPQVGTDADQIGQVVVNLLINAQQAVAERPHPRVIRVETGRAEERTRTKASICAWRTTAPACQTDLRARIFEPFFTTKPEGMGTGVGLSVSRSLARENGGELRLEESTQGASFYLWLPLNPEVAKPAPPREAPLPDRRTRRPRADRRR